MTDAFEVRQGVRQGCILSPILFLVVIDDVLTTTVGTDERYGIQWRPFNRLSHLDYADDVCFLAHTNSGLKHMCQALQDNGKRACLNINAQKTKTMHSGRTTQQHQPILLQQQPIEEVEQFTYLGSILTPDGGAELDVEVRINKARAAFGILSPVWRSKEISLRTKLKLFESNVKSVLLYACETWKVTARITKKLQTYINRCLRRILNIRWPQIISNIELWRRTNQRMVEVEIRQRKWRWIGHTLRKPNENIAKQSFEWNPQGTRRIGRPRKTWKKTVEVEAASQKKTWKELRRLAGNRNQWKEFVHALCPNGGVQGP
jgi:hypothetical protein